MTVAHPVSFVLEVTELKTSVGDVASTMSAHTAQLASSALFADMLTSFDEINKSLK